jgi:hypothetical protein
MGDRSAAPTIPQANPRDAVMSENSVDRILAARGELRRPIVVTENATNPLVPANRLIASPTIDQFVAKALMVAFAMIVAEKLGVRTPEMLLTQWYQSIQAFLLDRTHKPLCVGIAIRRAKRRLDHLHA